MVIASRLWISLVLPPRYSSTPSIRHHMDTVHLHDIAKLSPGAKEAEENRQPIRADQGYSPSFLRGPENTAWVPDRARLPSSRHGANAAATHGMRADVWWAIPMYRRLRPVTAALSWRRAAPHCASALPPTRYSTDTPDTRTRPGQFAPLSRRGSQRSVPERTPASGCP